MDEAFYTRLKAVGLRRVKRWRLADGRIFSLDDWAHEWAVSAWEADKKGSSIRLTHITGNTLRRCLRCSQPLRRGPYTVSPASWGHTYDSVLEDPAPGPSERAEFRELMCRLLRLACRWKLGRRIAVRRLHGQKLARIAARYGVSEARISQIVRYLEDSWKESFARPRPRGGSTRKTT